MAQLKIKKLLPSLWRWYFAFWQASGRSSGRKTCLSLNSRQYKLKKLRQKQR